MICTLGIAVESLLSITNPFKIIELSVVWANDPGDNIKTTKIKRIMPCGNLLIIDKKILRIQFI
jgi:hypothetical protein